MKSCLSLLLAALVLFVGTPTMDAFAAMKKKHKPMESFTGKISGLHNDRDHKKKHFWEYRLKTSSGRIVIVHDYALGRFRQPASQGLKEGANKSVRGFFVKISPKRGDPHKVPVLIVQH